MTPRPHARIAILGGSGLYDIAGLRQARDHWPDTPFGRPSDALRLGEMEGREVVFLARHGRGHRWLPSEINYRANIYALKQLGVERIFSASAVGSMREDVLPREVVLPDQFIDRTVGRASTFFGGGIVAHVPFADPVCAELRSVLLTGCLDAGVRAHDGGVYLSIEGPAFSTRAESRLYRSWEVDVIGMTNLQEAKLAREAEICYAVLALVTDFDCWHEDAEDVHIEAVLDNLRANSHLAARVLRDAVRTVPEGREHCSCGEALHNAIITDPAEISEETRARLAPIIGRYLP